MIRRNSRQRQSILEAIRGPGIHMNAEEVYQKVKEDDPTIGIATVYRNLNLLCDLKEIQKFQDRTAGFLYDGNPERHHHFYCRYCGQYTDVSVAIEQDLLNQLSKEMGVDIEESMISFEGCCKNCKEKKKRKEVN